MEKGDSGTVRVEARDRLPASGIIWPEYDLVVTAHHVVERDENYLAALSVGVKDLEGPYPEQSRGLHPGQWATAIGHPWGVPGVATSSAVIGWGSDQPEARSRSGDRGQSTAGNG